MTKKIKNSYLLLFFFLVAFIILSTGVASALEIKNYPVIPGLPNLNTATPDIASYVKYFFGLLVFIAGILSLISFTIGAVGLINPNVEAHGDAKDRMKGAVIGLALTLVSFIIINTINPALTNPSLTPLPPTAGVFYSNGTDTQPVGQTVSDVSTRPTGYDSIIYKCSASGPGTGPALLIWEYPKASFIGTDGGYAGVVTKRIVCGASENISASGSFQWDYERAGVYYCRGGCNGNMCSGYMSVANTNSYDGNIDDTFNGKISGVRIVNNPTAGLYYGVIFHQMSAPQKGGQCQAPIINLAEDNTGECFGINKQNNTSAADIFVLDKSPTSSSDGVNFFSEPFGADRESKSGYYMMSDSEIRSASNYLHDPQDMEFVYTNFSAVPEEYIIHNIWFSNHPGSIDINGNYLVALYSGVSYCQTFSANQIVKNLETEPVTGPQSDVLTGIYVIPTGSGGGTGGGGGTSGGGTGRSN
ncbi:MAG: hypothetical protein NTW11_03580 [Candidatus Staskawiczbacteria bacterium]|nr:hypothetical protein [Candidatus Staskawiczbacteria bacterium]